MDTQYKLAEPEPLDLSKSSLYYDRENYGKHARGFVGPKGWVISRNKTTDKWMMTHYHYTDYTLITPYLTDRYLTDRLNV